MTKSLRVWWMIFGMCATAVAGVMAWITLLVLDLEAAEGTARAEAAYQENLRLALWRMDSWLAPLLAREATRSFYEYQPYYSTPRPNYTKVLEKIDQGEVVAPSPLLDFESPFIVLHFEIEQNGRITSPQVPQGEQKQLAAQTCVALEVLDDRQEILESLRRDLTNGRTEDLVKEAERTAVSFACDSQFDAVKKAQPRQQTTSSKNLQEFSKRNAFADAAQSPVPIDLSQSAIRGLDKLSSPTLSFPQPIGAPGPLIPLWLDSAAGADRRLLYLRRVTIDGSDRYQGFLTDWVAMERAFREQISDLFEHAEIIPRIDSETSPDPRGILLATVPAKLQAKRPPIGDHSTRLTPARLTLGGAWAGVALSILMVGLALRSSILLGEKRRKFVSAVTHELRTPLTTFRMYSEMLAEDMVTDPVERRQYLATLKRESDRLSRLVENVLTYARLEEGRGTSRCDRTTVAELLESVKPPLVDRADEAGMHLAVESGQARNLEIRVDEDAVGQILFNLVDNACKYARNSTDHGIMLMASIEDRVLTLRVCDRGPGIESRDQKAIFDPFDRGSRDPSDPVPGIGLGLALCRDLAKNLGGNLSLCETPGGGASFVLTLPSHS